MPAMLEPVLIVATAVALTAWFVQHRWCRRVRRPAELRESSSTGLEVLARRYARGEIDREEYLEKRSDIVGTPDLSPGRP
jgi:uncharacterized membrane protein